MGDSTDVRALGWLIGFAVPQKIKYAGVQAFIRRLGGILLAITVLACGGLSLVIWRMTRPVRELTRAAGAIAKGNLDFTAPTVGTGDIGLLSQAFVSMRGALRERINSLHHEISERKRTEAQLQIAKANAENANQSKSMFLDNMSHEIRTPVNGVMGMMQLLKTTALNAEQTQYVDMAFNANRRLARLLGDILDLSSLEAGKLIILTEPFSMDELIRSVEQLFRVTTEQKGLDFRIAFDPQTLPTVYGDMTRVQQILINLVGNAVKFTHKGSITLEVSVLPGNDATRRNILFSVKDTGIGISDDAIDKLFTPFFQVEKSYTRRYQGAGLGLAIIKRLIEQLEGSISVESLEGVGTTFYVSLPFTLDNVAQHPASSVSGKEETAFDLHNIRALFAEDDKVNQLATKKLLEREGCVVQVVGDGAQALKALESQDFDLC